jgi:hypothetical protein
MQMAVCANRKTDSKRQCRKNYPQNKKALRSRYFANERQQTFHGVTDKIAQQTQATVLHELKKTQNRPASKCPILSAILQSLASPIAQDAN